jgi:[protein-PII] uridylyltransferase
MREYYRAAKEIFALCRETVDRVLDQRPGLRTDFLDFRTRLSNEDFTVSREQILLRHPAKMVTDPDLLHRLFVFQARHGLRLAADTRRRLSGGAPWKWPQWKAVLSQPHAARALRDMMESGELERQLPEWSRIDCLVARDFYHRYTVDEHTMIALENLERIVAKHRRFAPLWQECEQKAVLRFALLLHDIGKGEGHDHDRRSVEIAQVAGARLSIPAAEQQWIERLIADHLYLGQLTQTRDLDDPATAEQAAQFLKTQEYLAMLAMLTYADSSAVFPGAMTAWRETQLWHAYSVVHRALTKALEDVRIPAREYSSRPDMAQFLEGFPSRYWNRSTKEEREAHFLLSQKALEAGVGLALERGEDTWNLAMVTKDRPRLLADLAGVLAAFGMNILKAEVFGNSRGFALDRFVFADPLHSLELNPPVVQELKDALSKVVTGKEHAERLLRKKHRPPPRYRVAIEPVLRIDNDSSQLATLLELVASDRPGLLYDVARTIADCGCEIDTVLLNTEGQRAMDVFYIRSGTSKLAPETVRLLESKLEEVI